MYLEHFKIREFPFSITPNPGFYCELPGHQEAMNVLLVSLRSGEGFIKIVGEVGSGKTLLCRLLLENLDDHFVSAYIPNPALTPDGLRRALAKELDLTLPPIIDQHSLLDLINGRLLDLHRQGKQVVLLLDEAQALPDDSLEALRLLTNLETSTTKLLQVIMFGQPELDKKLEQPSLRQLRQRVTFSYQLPMLTRKQCDAYIHHRLAKAGHTYGRVFTPKACKLLFRGSHGLPRIINILSHKAMMAAFGKGSKRVDYKAVRRAISDTEGASKAPSVMKTWWLSGIGLLLLSCVFLAIKLRF